MSNGAGLRQWTYTELAKKTGLSLPFVSRLMRGLRKPSIVTIIRISRATGLTIQEIVDDLGIEADN